MITFVKWLALLGLVAAVAVASCLAVYFGVIQRDTHPVEAPASFSEMLGLHPPLSERVDEREAAFDKVRMEILEDFRIATARLSGLLKTESELTPEVAQSIEEIHRIHGALQTLSVERFFAVLEVLPDEKQPVLREMAARALSRPE